MRQLTDEERKVLLLDLRNADLTDAVMCDDAANEIARLEQEVKFWKLEALTFEKRLARSGARIRELEAEAGYTFDRNRGRIR